MNTNLWKGSKMNKEFNPEYEQVCRKIITDLGLSLAQPHGLKIFIPCVGILDLSVIDPTQYLTYIIDCIYKTGVEDGRVQLKNQLKELII